MCHRDQNVLRLAWLVAVVMAPLTSGCDGVMSGGDVGPNADTGGTRDAGAEPTDAVDIGPVDAPLPEGAHPLYPALDLGSLPGAGGGASGPYEVPELPVTEREVTIAGSGGSARDQLEAACAEGASRVIVPDAAGSLGVVNLGGFDDCDVTLGSAVEIEWLVIGSLRGPMLAPVHRLRVRGGRLGGVYIAEETTDVVLDGVIVDNAVAPPASRRGIAFEVGSVDRLAVVRSTIRLLPVDVGGGVLDGCGYLGSNARNVLFADDNLVTSGNRNSWGFRIGGGENYLLVDLSVRVSFHKLVRMNDAPVDYVLIRGGVWMREATRTVEGLEINDSFAQLGATVDHVYVEDLDVHLLSNEPVGFGMTFGPEQAGRSWIARDLRWHAPSSNAVSASHLAGLAGSCTAGATCDYGDGSSTFEYDPAITFPASPWRPGLPDPDAL